MRDDQIRIFLSLCWKALREAKSPQLSFRYHLSTIESAETPNEIGRAMTALVAQAVLFNPRPPKLEKGSDVVAFFGEMARDAKHIRLLALETAAFVDPILQT
jgi:hypothetical protein